MKVHVKTLLILLVIGFQPLVAQSSMDDHDAHLNRMMKAYFALSNALASDDFDTAKKHANVLSDEVMAQGKKRAERMTASDQPSKKEKMKMKEKNKDLMTPKMDLKQTMDSSSTVSQRMKNDVQKGKKEMKGHAHHHNENMGGKHHMEKGSSMMEKHGKMVVSVTKAKNATDIEQLREAYLGISEHLIAAAKNHGYDQKLYVQFCPMADGNKGASWLSTNKEILNPYFGSTMLKCGTITEEIEEK